MPQEKQLSALETLYNWVDKELKLEGYEHKEIMAKIESLLPQEQVTPDGYIFEGRLYTTVDELKGQTFSDGNSPVAVYFIPQEQVKVYAEFELNRL